MLVIMSYFSAHEEAPGSQQWHASTFDCVVCFSTCCCMQQKQAMQVRLARAIVFAPHDRRSIGFRMILFDLLDSTICSRIFELNIPASTALKILITTTGLPNSNWTGQKNQRSSWYSVSCCLITLAKDQLPRYMYAPHIGLDTLKFQLHWAQGIDIFCPTLVLSIGWCIRYLISFPELSSVCVSSDRRTHRRDQHIPRLILVACTYLFELHPRSNQTQQFKHGPIHGGTAHHLGPCSALVR